MHYKNGREAKPGDKVVHIEGDGTPRAGILYNTNASKSCNGRLAAISANDHYVTIGDCLHADDVKAAKDILDSTAPAG